MNKEISETDHMILNHMRNIPDEGIISISQKKGDMCIIEVDDTDFSKIEKEFKTSMESSEDLLADKTEVIIYDEPILL